MAMPVQQKRSSPKDLRGLRFGRLLALAEAEPIIKRNTRFVTFRGARMSLADACDLSGLAYGTVITRLRDGWDERRALETSIA